MVLPPSRDRQRTRHASIHSLWITAPLDIVWNSVYLDGTMKKVASKRRKEIDKCKLQFRLEPAVFEQLRQLAKREDRTMPYLVRRYIQAGLQAEVRNR